MLALLCVVILLDDGQKSEVVTHSVQESPNARVVLEKGNHPDGSQVHEALGGHQEKLGFAQLLHRQNCYQTVQIDQNCCDCKGYLKQEEQQRACRE